MTFANTRSRQFPNSIIVFFYYCQHYLKYVLLVCSFPCLASFQVLHKENSFLACFGRMHFETNFEEPQHSCNTKSSNINGERSHNHMLCARPHIRAAFTHPLSRDSNHGAHATALKLSSTHAFQSIIQ